MIRIAIVNDLKLAVEALRRVVKAQPDAEIAWIAEDGQQAVQKCRKSRPDLILMDLIMPVMDGVEATRQIMQDYPCPILVVTATVEGNCAKVYEALGHGALDAVNTPVLGPTGDVSGADQLVRKIRCVMQLRGGKAAGLELTTPAASPVREPIGHESSPLVAIGASTGGPQALAQVLSSLQRPLSCSVVVVQHLDPHFVPGLAEWLSGEVGLPIQVVQDQQRPTPGTVHVACTTDHLVLLPSRCLGYVREPIAHVYRPSVDVFFQSLLKVTADRRIAVLLTGMGRDGAVGLKALRQAGWKTIAQDKQSSIVWGMPGEAVRLDAADLVLSLDMIGPAINKALNQPVGSRK